MRIFILFYLVSFVLSRNTPPLNTQNEATDFMDDAQWRSQPIPQANGLNAIPISNSAPIMGNSPLRNSEKSTSNPPLTPMQSQGPKPNVQPDQSFSSYSTDSEVSRPSQLPGFIVHLSYNAINQTKSLIFDILFRQEGWKVLLEKLPPSFGQEYKDNPYLHISYTISNLEISKFRRPTLEDLEIATDSLKLAIFDATIGGSVKVKVVRPSNNQELFEAAISFECPSANFGAVMLPYFENVYNKTSEKWGQRLQLQINSADLIFNVPLIIHLDDIMIYGSNSAFMNKSINFMVYTFMGMFNTIIHRFLEYVTVWGLKTYVPGFVSSGLDFVGSRLISLLDDYVSTAFDIHLGLSERFSISDQKLTIADRILSYSADVKYDFLYGKDPETEEEEFKKWFYSETPRKWSTENDLSKRMDFFDSKYVAYHPRRSLFSIDCLKNICKTSERKGTPGNTPIKNNNNNSNDVKEQKPSLWTRFKNFWKNMFRRKPKQTATQQQQQ